MKSTSDPSRPPRRRRRYGPAAAACAILLLSTAPGQGVAGRASVAKGYDLQVGQPFPDIRLPSLADGRPLSIRDLRGKKTLLMIFASW